jgi:hypothetical protein
VESEGSTFLLIMKHFKLFEEFNKLTGKKFIDKLRLYAEASPVSKKVSPIRLTSNDYLFDIVSNIPAENSSGEKTFLIKVPTDIVSKVLVTTYVEGKEVFSQNLEPDGENDIDVILRNFIEAAQLYDDTIIETIIAAHDKVHTVNDIHNLIKNGIDQIKKA